MAEVRLVRLDAEGNPVDGSAESRTLVDYVKKVYLERVATLDDEVLWTAKRVTVTATFEEVSEEFMAMVRGESEHCDSAADRGIRPVDHEEV